ncbi:MAG: iron transporter [Lachnospiraceae bacterium]|nr:iron transporter [Lachnospiraceae bacterium]MCM1239535.1 iron transporter [Lachnospiraceae bacterium]
MWKGMGIIKSKICVFFPVMLSVMLLAGCGGTSASGNDGNVSPTSAPGTDATLAENAESGSATLAEDAKSGGTSSSEDAKSGGIFGAEAPRTAELPDGTYSAEFSTDSSMFRVNETCGGRGTLTVENGEMTIHISLGSKKIVNLYPGLAADAAKESEELLQPTEDTVTYSDGMTEVVYGFDVPVPVLGEEFDLALIGTKGVWYDHKVSVSDPVALEDDLRSGEADGQLEPQAAGAGSRTEPQGESAGDQAAGAGSRTESQGESAGSQVAGTGGQSESQESAGSPADGTYSLDITFEGGSGKAYILSPVTVTVTDGKATATVQWSSPNYDYMIVDGEKYLPVNAEGDSVFEIPVLCFDEPMDMIGDTVAMSKPHEVEYKITFHLER